MGYYFGDDVDTRALIVKVGFFTSALKPAGSPLLGSGQDWDVWVNMWFWSI